MVNLIAVHSLQVTANQNPSQLLQEKLEQYRGNVIYVDFWASWCKPCIQSFPWMNQMKTRFESKGLKIVTVNLDKERQLAENFMRENPALFEVIYDSEGKIASKFDLIGMPMSFTFDRSGKVRGRHTGFNKKKQHEYEMQIIELLKREQSVDD